MKSSNFSILLTACILLVIGVALAPLIDVGSKPRPRQGRDLWINYSWQGKSAKVVEQGVTAPIEGLMVAVRGVENVESESRYGSGWVKVTLKPDINVSAVRFEIASLLRQIRGRLPEGVSTPTLSGGDIVNYSRQREETVHLLSYTVNSPLTAMQLQDYVRQHVAPALQRNEDVRGVNISGGTGQYLEITYDPLLLQACGLSADDMENGLKAFFGRNEIVGDVLRDSARVTLRLATAEFRRPLEQMPIKSTGGQVVYMGDLARYEYKNYEPSSYYRINGHETVSLNIYVNAQANLTKLARELRSQIDEMQPHMQEGVKLELQHDSSEELQGEMDRLITRSFMSLVILLLFVFLVRPGWRYVSIVAATLVLCLAMAAVCYYAFNLRLHVFSIAGITVSLGLVIDSSIVMIDHYAYYRDRKAFFAILAALLTTIGTLVVILFAPDNLRHDLYDFAWVVIINLTVALLVAIAFVPALVDAVHFRTAGCTPKSTRRRRYIIRWNRMYARYISFPSQLRPRWRVVLYSMFILLYLGGFGYSAYVFSKSMGGVSWPREEEEMKLYIRAQMPLGGTATQLNEKVRLLEEMLAAEPAILRFETSVNGGGAIITVRFTPEALGTAAPYQVENRVIGRVIGIGGADWSTYGVSQRGFSNSLNLQYRSNRIEMAGYNYDRLYRYAQDLCDLLSQNPRAVDITIETPGYENQEDEYYVRYNWERMHMLGINPEMIYRAVGDILQTRDLGWWDKTRTDVTLVSSRRDTHDLWQLLNSHVKVGDSDILLSEVMDIQRREAKNVIPRRNQEYVLRVAFNVLGSYSYINKYVEEVTRQMSERLPVGFRCMRPEWSGIPTVSQQYWLIALCIIITYWLMAILFESLMRPLAILLSLIPMTLIAVFLTFQFAGIPFGTGGLAAIVLLCGLVVNAAIYILHQYDLVQATSRVSPVKAYVCAYNHKIIPVMLTVLSTMLGLIPFLLDGIDNKFWYTFAITTMAGLTASVVALVFVLPWFVGMKTKNVGLTNKA